MAEKSITVTRLVRRMKNLLEIEIGEIWVEGEISNYKCYASGHAYFTLKDEGAQISCVFFKGMAVRSRVRPQSGMQVRLFGEVSLYESRGQLQLIVKEVQDAGLGDLQARFEALKQKLNAEGLFDSSRKKKLPSFPLKIGIITSPNGAALQDILNILSRRAPWVKAILYPVQVQGKGAEKGIATAIQQLGTPEKYGYPQVDVIIVGRGGGSLEDLWNFNEEVVARAIYQCPIPIVSAVGHEIDFSISDFAADLRAPTPSAAAELVVPDAEELRGKVKSISQSLKRAMENRLKGEMSVLNSLRRTLMPRGRDGVERALRDPIQELDRLQNGLKLAVFGELDVFKGRLAELKIRHAAHHPERVMIRRSERLQHVQTRLLVAVESGIRQAEQRMKRLSSLVCTLGPDATFARGFSITMNAEGKIIKDPSEVQVGEKLIHQVEKGKITTTVSN